MSELGLSLGSEQRLRRRWFFAGCVLDEATWSLTVDGARVSIETKPLELLRELLIAGGSVVSKAEFLDRIWPDVTVVEASLPTAVHKLRLALGDETRSPHIVETVPRVGYRLGVPVELDQGSASAEESSASAPQEIAASAPFRNRLMRSAPLLAISGGIILAFLLAAPTFTPSGQLKATKARGPVTQREAASALRRLDVGKIEDLLAAGWDPNKPFDREGNAALNYVVGECEWNRLHDQEQMVLMVRTLIDNGARLDHRNVWGDTAYSIAKAVRYCGPDHPVTRSIRTMCYAGYKPLGDRCLASYELPRQ